MEIKENLIALFLFFLFHAMFTKNHFNSHFSAANYLTQKKTNLIFILMFIQDHGSIKNWAMIMIKNLTMDVFLINYGQIWTRFKKKDILKKSKI